MKHIPAIDTLQVPDRKELYLTSHPLEGLPEDAGEEKELQRISHFIEAACGLGVKTITILLPEEELKKASHGRNLMGLYRDAGLEILHYPLENFSIPDAIDLFDAFIEEILKRLNSEPLLIHCLTGCGRTGMTASGVLVRLGFPVSDAIEQVNQARPSSTHTLQQIVFLKDYRRWLEREKPVP
jgi:protein tyrosine phosphatase (PTP) superfamily phosphohydrolase (DUF442 family)